LQRSNTSVASLPQCSPPNSEVVQFEVVSPDHFDDYLGWDEWLYGGKDFNVLQIVYPTTDGIWPWEPGACEWFRARQPILSDDLRKGGLT